MLTFEFVRLGDPCSVQVKNKSRMDNYKRDVERAAVARWPGNSSPVIVPVSVIITYFYTQDIMDVDNIIKPVLDQMNGLVYADDKQVISVTCRKINVLIPEAVVAITSPVLASAFRSKSDFLHVLSNGNDQLRITIMQTTYHNERVAAVAHQYRLQGYQVMQEPATEQLPDFLRETGYRPDILAKNGRDFVIVEVQSYGQVTRSRRLEKLARSVEAQPGWRLELILSNPAENSASETSTVKAPQLTIEFPEIEDRIKNSKYLAATGDLRSAVILLYSALEATLRIGLEKIPASFINNESAAIIKQGIAYGLMDPEDADVLAQLLPVRNSVVHGFAGTVDAELLAKSTRITKSILEEVKGLD